MKNVFQFTESSYNVQNESKFLTREVRSARCGIGTSSFKVSRIWYSIPRELPGRQLHAQS